MLFDDTDKAAAEGRRSSVVATAQRLRRGLSPSQITRLTGDGLPVHSFHSLLAISRNLGTQHHSATAMTTN